MRTLREAVRRAPLIRVPARPSRILELEEGDFAKALDDAESIHQQTQRARVVIQVTSDPPDGRVVQIAPLGVSRRLGPEWRDWLEWWSGAWHELQREMRRPSGNRGVYLPDEATLERERIRAGAMAAKSVIRSTV